MARYYRRRYTRVVRPKKKWASNLVDPQISITVDANTVMYQGTLCENSTQTSKPTPVIIKTGNFKLQMDAYFILSEPSAVQFSAYIIYVPEGISIGSYTDARDLINKHPEWVMAWKYASFDYSSGTSNIETVQMSSRLKRNLNSGDKIMFIGLGSTGSGVTFSQKGMNGKCQFWTCAN